MSLSVYGYMFSSSYNLIELKEFQPEDGRDRQSFTPTPVNFAKLKCNWHKQNLKTKHRFLNTVFNLFSTLHRYPHIVLNDIYLFLIILIVYQMFFVLDLFK